MTKTNNKSANAKPPKTVWIFYTTFNDTVKSTFFYGPPDSPSFQSLSSLSSFPRAHIQHIDNDFELEKFDLYLWRESVVIIDWFFYIFFCFIQGKQIFSCLFVWIFLQKKLCKILSFSSNLPEVCKPSLEYFSLDFSPTPTSQARVYKAHPTEPRMRFKTPWGGKTGHQLFPRTDFPSCRAELLLFSPKFMLMVMAGHVCRLVWVCERVSVSFFEQNWWPRVLPRRRKKFAAQRVKNG